jgi:2-methylisocitrate lyase-like PEP mutase family enzyme
VPDVRDALERAGLLADKGADGVFATYAEALEAARLRVTPQAP